MPEPVVDPLSDPRHKDSAFVGILAGSTAQIEEILGPRTHPDVARVISVVHLALSVQRRQLARRLRAEAVAAKYGETPVKPGQATYPGGLYRAARIVEGGQRNS